MSDREYFKMRAEQERAAAIAAADPAVCRIHMDLAKEYDFRAATGPADEFAQADAPGPCDLPVQPQSRFL